MHDDSQTALRTVIHPENVRGHVGLAAGFALAVQPISGETITTDTTGLEAGRSNPHVQQQSRVPGDAGQGGSNPGHAGRPGDLRGPRTYQGRLPAVGQGGYLAVGLALYARQGDVGTLRKPARSSPRSSPRPPMPR